MFCRRQGGLERGDVVAFDLLPDGQCRGPARVALRELS
jgi:hypothetical protein